MTDTGFNLVNSAVDEDTILNTTTAIESAPTVADPVSTPVNQDTTQPTQETQQQQTQQTPPSTPPQNNPPQQGGYGGYWHTVTHSHSQEESISLIY